MFESASPGSPQDACPVRIIHKYCRVVQFSQGGNVGERRNIPIHAEKTVGYDESGLDGGSAGEQSFQMTHVSMVVHPKRGAAQSAAIDEARMTEAVGEYKPALTNKGGNHADIGQISSCKCKGGFRAFELCEGCFECFVWWESATYKARCSGSRSILPGSRYGSFHNGRMRRKA
jgi:hypothetical protein